MNKERYAGTKKYYQWKIGAIYTTKISLVCMQFHKRV